MRKSLRWTCRTAHWNDWIAAWCGLMRISRRWGAVGGDPAATAIAGTGMGDFSCESSGDRPGDGPAEGGAGVGKRPRGGASHCAGRVGLQAGTIGLPPVADGCGFPGVGGLFEKTPLRLQSREPEWTIFHAKNRGTTRGGGQAEGGAGMRKAARWARPLSVSEEGTLIWARSSSPSGGLRVSASTRPCHCRPHRRPRG